MNALCPGPVNTPLLQELFAKDPERAARRLVHVPMGRFAEADEIDRLLDQAFGLLQHLCLIRLACRARAIRVDLALPDTVGFQIGQHRRNEIHADLDADQSSGIRINIDHDAGPARADARRASFFDKTPSLQLG